MESLENLEEFGEMNTAQMQRRKLRWANKNSGKVYATALRNVVQQVDVLH